MLRRSLIKLLRFAVLGVMAYIVGLMLGAIITTFLPFGIP